MREIKFRGKRVDSGEWVYGDFTRSEGLSHITSFALNSFCKSAPFYVIERETLGQYTGLKDCNGVEIYEGDILRSEGDSKVNIKTGWKTPNSWWCTEVVGHERGCFTSSIIGQDNYWFGELPQKPQSLFHAKFSRHQIIGNITDNPELLESNK